MYRWQNWGCQPLHASLSIPGVVVPVNHLNECQLWTHAKSNIPAQWVSTGSSFTCGTVNVKPLINIWYIPTKEASVAGARLTPPQWGAVSPCGTDWWAGSAPCVYIGARYTWHALSLSSCSARPWWWLWSGAAWWSCMPCWQERPLFLRSNARSLLWRSAIATYALSVGARCGGLLGSRGWVALSWALAWLRGLRGVSLRGPPLVSACRAAPDWVYCSAYVLDHLPLAIRNALLVRTRNHYRCHLLDPLLFWLTGTVLTLFWAFLKLHTEALDRAGVRAHCSIL